MTAREQQQQMEDYKFAMTEVFQFLQKAADCLVYVENRDDNTKTLKKMEDGISEIFRIYDRMDDLEREPIDSDY